MSETTTKTYINPYRLFTGAFIPNWLLRRPKISMGAKITYARLCQFAGEKGECYPKQKNIASEIGVSERQVVRYIKELQEKGLIEIIRTSYTCVYKFPNHKFITSDMTKTSYLRYDKNVLSDMTKTSYLRYDKNVLSDMTKTSYLYKENQRRESSKEEDGQQHHLKGSLVSLLGEESAKDSAAQPKSVKQSNAKSRKPEKLPDDAWLLELAQSEAYKDIDVQKLFAKMEVWCKTFQKQPSRKRFLNWLNRETPKKKEADDDRFSFLPGNKTA